MPIRSKNPKKIIETEMENFKAGNLHSGKGGPIVTNPKQAIAISLSEARRKGKGKGKPKSLKKKKGK